MAKILVVDNDRSIAERTVRELEGEGYDVLTAVDANGAMRIFQSQHPDLVLLEICLPGMDGLEVMSHLQSIDRGVRVVLNSAHPHYRENFLSWSADAYIDKSDDLTELKRTLRDLLLTHSTNPIRAGWRAS